jgi:hypothetical protein
MVFGGLIVLSSTCAGLNKFKFLKFFQLPGKRSVGSGGWMIQAKLQVRIYPFFVFLKNSNFPFSYFLKHFCASLKLNIEGVTRKNAAAYRFKISFR